MGGRILIGIGLLVEGGGGGGGSWSLSPSVGVWGDWGEFLLNSPLVIVAFWFVGLRWRVGGQGSGASGGWQGTGVSLLE